MEDAFEVIPEKILAELKEEGLEVTEEDPVRAYLREIGKIPLLTPERERELAIRAEQGDVLAKKELAEANLSINGDDCLEDTEDGL